MYYDRLSDLNIKLSRRTGQEKCFCPQCHDGRKNKRDKSLSVNINTGEYHCHNCGWKGNVRSFNRREEKKNYEKPDQNLLRQIDLQKKVIEWFNARAISEETLKKFMIFCKEEWMPQTEKKENCICFPYLRDGELVNVKYRDARKNFRMHKDAELIFYNLQSVGEKKYVIITEGEIDCMAVYETGYGKEYEPQADEKTGEVLDHPLGKYSVISVPNGASKGSQKMEYLDNCSDWVLGVSEFVIATDGDDAGKMLKDELIRRLGVERCRIVSYPTEEVVPTQNGLKRRCKDLNEVLQYFGKKTVINCIENSEMIPVDGVYFLDDIFPTMLENFERGVHFAPTTHFKIVDEYFRWKKGDINLFTGYGNHGKTTFAIQLMLIKSLYSGWKWAIFSPENYPANDFYDDIVEMYSGKWLQNMTKDEYVNACYFIDKHIFYVYPDDEHDITSIHEKFRYLVLKKGIDGVMIDPFNQLDKTQRPYERDDQYLSIVLKDIKRFALLNNIVYNIVAHPVKPQRGQDKSLPVVDMYDISGGAMWGNKCDQIISYYRPQFHVDKNSPEVEIFIQKVKRKRTGGQLGSFPLNFIWSKKRFCDPFSGDMPCDPIEAGIEKGKQGKQIEIKNWYDKDSDDLRNALN